MVPFVHHIAFEVDEVGLGAAQMVGVEHIAAVGLLFLIVKNAQRAADGLIGLRRGGGGAEPRDKGGSGQEGNEFTHSILLQC